jgi:hypothetical protein
MNTMNMTGMSTRSKKNVMFNDTPEILFTPPATRRDEEKVPKPALK